MPGRKAPEERRRKDILAAAYDVAVRHGIEALTVRAVATRAKVSHGTVLFHFNRREALVTALLQCVLEATTVLHIPPNLERLTPGARLRALLRAEMERLSGDPRHFRLFLEYWALGVRNAMLRRRVSAALDAYRRGFRAVSETLAPDDGATRGRTPNPSRATTHAVVDGLDAVAVSLVHGCVLQAVIDPKNFSVLQHFETASELLDALGVTGRSAPPGSRRSGARKSGRLAFR